jgi:rhodanese-related sulfurtransferase
VLLPSSEAWQRASATRGEKPLAVVCGDQVRSSLVASILLRHGRQAVLVFGGMVDWLERGFEVEKPETVTKPS